MIKHFINESNTSSYFIKFNEMDLSKGIINMCGYVRVSTQLQAMYGSSIETQINLLIDECNRPQWDDNSNRIKYNLLYIFCDDGISGKSVAERPSLIAMQNHINSLINGRTHQKLGIIVSDLSRLTRSSSDLENFIKWFTAESIKVRFIDTSIDLSTNSGSLMLKMMASFYEYERLNSSFKTRLTLRSMSEANTLPGHCSYGWTTGTNEMGRKINIPVPEEQEGLQEVIRLSREYPHLKPYEIKNIMNESGILCLRGPGRNFRGIKISENTIKKISETSWTGKWTTQIIEKIIEHDQFEKRKKIVAEKGDKINIMKKDEIVIKTIKEHLEETDGYNEERFNFSEISRMLDSKLLFQKPLNRNYVKQMMIASRIIKPDAQAELKNKDDKIVEDIRKLVDQSTIVTYVRLTDVLKEKKFPLVGKRNQWTPSNVRDLCIKYKIVLK
jgi:DNA invertase Pin-like site-specific DNA recombinase